MRHLSGRAVCQEWSRPGTANRYSSAAVHFHGYFGTAYISRTPTTQEYYTATRPLINLLPVQTLLDELKRFRLKLAGEIEPKPGVPPSARHLSSIGRRFKEKGVKAILQEPFYNAKAAQKVAQACGAKVVIRANCTGGADGIDDYVSMLDSVLTGLKDALEAR